MSLFSCNSQAFDLPWHELKCSHRRNQSLAFTSMHEQLFPHPPHVTSATSWVLLQWSRQMICYMLLRTEENTRRLVLQWPHALWTPDFLCSPYVHVFRSPALWTKVQCSVHPRCLNLNVTKASKNRRTCETVGGTVPVCICDAQDCLPVGVLQSDSDLLTTPSFA